MLIKVVAVVRGLTIEFVSSLPIVQVNVTLNFDSITSLIVVAKNGVTVVSIKIDLTALCCLFAGGYLTATSTKLVACHAFLSAAGWVEQVEQGAAPAARRSFKGKLEAACL